jgi:hypothetical protein
MLKRFLFLTILIPLFLVTVAQAQGPLRLSDVEVNLWPEYDRPDVLVIYHVKLPSDVTLPVDVILRIPAVAGEPHAVAVRQMDGGLLNAAYERQVESEWALIKVTATMPEIQLEYYDPQIDTEEDLHRYAYTWLSDYSVDTMRIIIQQPVGASQMSVEPDLGSFTQVQGDPMQYYAMEIGSPKADEPVGVELTYLKDTDILSIESLQVQPSAPINGNTGEQPGIITLLPWLIGGLGVLLLVGGGLWFWQLNKTDPQSVSQKRGRKPKAAIKSPEQVAAENDGEGIYCHQCGKRAASGDRFCRVCGTKLRSK